MLAWDFVGKCPFCQCNPFNYTRNESGETVVTITCCNTMVDFFKKNFRFPSVQEVEGWIGEGGVNPYEGVPEVDIRRS